MTQLTHISGSVFHFWVTHICDLSLFPPKNPLLAPTNSIAHYFPPDEECSCAKWVEGLHRNWKHLDQAIALFHPVVGVGVDALFARFFVVDKKIISKAPKNPYNLHLGMFTL